MNEGKQERKKGRLSTKTFWDFIVKAAAWTVLLPAGTIFFLHLADRLDYQWLYDVSPWVYYQVRNLCYGMMNYGRLLFAALLPVWVGGMCFLLYRLIRRIFSYVEALSRASAEMFDRDVDYISLPPELEEFQQQMNHLKKESEMNERLARESEQRKNDMVVYLAHDLKTPLTSVIGYLSLLRDEPQLSPELRARYTGIALEKAERLEELINEFFDITRFSLTTLTLEMEPTDLTRMLEQIAYEFQPILREKGLTIRSELQNNVSILCDRNKLERVFDNLLRNAVNYSYRNSEIRLIMKREPGVAVIKVKNCGKTISEEKLSHIFEQFFRMDSSRSSETGGAGLGLAIAREIVDLHGGRITAESREESICFTVVLPLPKEKTVEFVRNS